MVKGKGLCSVPKQRRYHCHVANWAQPLNCVGHWSTQKVISVLGLNINCDRATENFCQLDVNYSIPCREAWTESGPTGNN